MANVQVTPVRSIDELVFLIHKRFEKVVETQQKFFAARVECGLLLLELRQRITAEGQDWWPWYATKFARSRRDAERVMELASQEDPEAAHRQEKAATQQRVAEIRKLARATYSTSQNSEAESKTEDQPQQIRLVKSPEVKSEIRWDKLNRMQAEFLELNRPERHQYLLMIKRACRE